MTSIKNTLNYFPRGNKSKTEGEGAFIFNSKEVNKKSKRDSAKLFANKKRRVKTGEVLGEEHEFIVGQKKEYDLKEESKSNKIPRFHLGKGSLVLMIVKKVHKDQFVV
jgi:hypothetical protein